MKPPAGSGVPWIPGWEKPLPRPGGAGTASGGDARFIEPLARAAVAVGVEGLFVEVHEAPERALSDGPNALKLDRLGALLDKLRRIREIV